MISDFELPVPEMMFIEHQSDKLSSTKNTKVHQCITVYYAASITVYKSHYRCIFSMQFKCILNCVLRWTNRDVYSCYNLNVYRIVFDCLFVYISKIVVVQVDKSSCGVGREHNGQV